MIDAMSIGHLTLPTQHVERTASFFEQTLGYRRTPSPGNSPAEAQWLDVGRRQQLHLIFVEGFTASAFEGEFGRHVAVFHPRADFPALRQRLADAGAELMEAMRETAFERFFFRDPVNGYVFEVVGADLAS